MEYHEHVCVYLYLLPNQTAHSLKPILACLYPSIVSRAYTTCTYMYSTCACLYYFCCIIRFLVKMSTHFEFVLFSILLRMIEGIGSAGYITASFTIATILYPTKTGTVIVREINYL